MKHTDFTDKALETAASEVREQLLKAPDTQDAQAFPFSEDFENSMDAMLRKNRRKVNAMTGFKRAMAACLAVALCMTAWLAVDVDAREAIIEWAKSLFSYGSTMRVEAYQSKPEDPLPEMVAYYLPDKGYQEVSRETDGEKIVVTYAAEDSSVAFGFTYEWAPIAGEYWFDTPQDTSGSLEMIYDFEDYSLFTPDDLNLPKTLSWYSFHSNSWTMQFTLSFYFDTETALKVAENILPREKAEQMTLPAKRVTYVPEGLRIFNRFNSQGHCTSHYFNIEEGSYDSSARRFLFTYHRTGFEGALYNDNSFKTGFTKTIVPVNDTDGRLYTLNNSRFGRFGKLLVWNEGDLEFALLFSGIDVETAVAIAESVE